MLWAQSRGALLTCALRPSLGGRQRREQEQRQRSWKGLNLREGQGEGQDGVTGRAGGQSPEPSLLGTLRVCGPPPQAEGPLSLRALSQCRLHICVFKDTPPYRWRID